MAALGAIFLEMARRMSSSLTLEFNAPGGTILDSTGVGTGFTTRLPGTGGGLPANDPNLTLDTGAGVLNMKSQQADYNGAAGLGINSAPGVNLSSLGFSGDQDFRVAATFGPLTGREFIDQAGVYVGTGATAMTLRRHDRFCGRGVLLRAHHGHRGQ